MSFWSDPIGSTVGTVNTVGRDISNVVSGVGQIGQAIINNPLPIIETLAITAALGPGGALAIPGLSAAQIAAITGAAVSAANGGNPQQIATAAATAGVGAEVTQVVAPEVGPTPIQGAATGSVNPIASAAGGAAGSATQAALTGQDVGKAALKGGLTGGAAAAGAQEVSSVLSPGSMAGTGLKATPDLSGDLNAPFTVQTPGGSVRGENLATGVNVLGQPMIPTEGGLGLVGDPNVILPASLSQYATAPANYRAGADGSLVPQYQAGANTITPGGFTQYNLEGESQPASVVTAEPQITPGLSPEAQSALQSVFGFGIGTALAPKPTGPRYGGTGVTTATTTGATSGTTGGAPGGTELDPSTGKAPQLVWGDKYSSLKEGLNV
jgi:hypothetical protein